MCIVSSYRAIRETAYFQFTVSDQNTIISGITLILILHLTCINTIIQCNLPTQDKNTDLELSTAPHYSSGT